MTEQAELTGCQGCGYFQHSAGMSSRVPKSNLAQTPSH